MVHLRREDISIFMEIPKPKAKKTVNLDPNPNSYPSKLPYPERMKVREHDKPSAQHSRFLKMFKQLRLEIGLKDALVEMPKFNKWLSSLLRNKEKLEEIAITTVNAEYDPFSGSTTTHSNDPSPSSSRWRPSDLFCEVRRCTWTPLNSYHSGNDDFNSYETCMMRNFQEDVEIKNSTFPRRHSFLDNILIDDDSTYLDFQIDSVHEPEQNESSITFSQGSDPLHHEFDGEPLTLPARMILSKSLSLSPITLEDSDTTQRWRLILSCYSDNLIPPGVKLLITR
ncbi:hypothetical protein Tco_0766278 [Tanacetum coccineum]|uniref:Uncharacterized protein n=1 Tax=Tanacetum coccineum TaxID=301880 RepID=A0ABQ4WTQ5_9ASTR